MECCNILSSHVRLACLQPKHIWWQWNKRWKIYCYKVNYWDQQRDLIDKNSLHHSIVPTVCLCTTGLDLWHYGVGKNQFIVQLLHRRWKYFVKILHLMNSSWFATWMKRGCSFKWCPGQLICIPARIVHHLHTKGMSSKDRLIVLMLHWCLWLIESCNGNYG